MATPLLEVERTWEEIVAKAPDFNGLKLHVIVLPIEEGNKTTTLNAQVEEEDTLGRLIDTCKMEPSFPWRML